jgi:hypothetical protein
VKVLYSSYDGLMEALGNSQVLQYLKKPTPGKQIFPLTYEKPPNRRAQASFLKLISAPTSWANFSPAA